jgi:hypothetical protein
MSILICRDPRAALLEFGALATAPLYVITPHSRGQLGIRAYQVC